ncbi:MAG: hypothetical protein O8C66_14795 [Candidatus Methanoperedens sp.]|nr:hypothetical protein [Candidatus Methanoperedens sp.]MCZ7371769.1 hypothetical protein [Candidatus Methanoperedens sp.]
MSILDVTEDQIFQTLGKGRDPNFKPIEKVRPVIVKPKKTYTLNQTIRTAQTVKAITPQAVVAVSEPVKIVPSPQVDESMVKLTVQLNELNNRVNGIQKMVKYYIMPQFVIVLVLLVALFVKG